MQEHLEIVRALTPVIVPLLVKTLKETVVTLPKWALPWIALLAGVLLEVLRAYASDTGADVVVGAGLGLTGVGLREIVDQSKQGVAKASIEK